MFQGALFLSATGKIPVGGFKDCDCPEILTWRPETMLTSYNREDGRESILCRQAQGVMTRLSLLGTRQDKDHVSVFASKRKVGQEITLAWLVGKPREERRYLVWTPWSLDGDLSVARWISSPWVSCHPGTSPTVKPRDLVSHSQRWSWTSKV